MKLKKLISIVLVAVIAASSLISVNAFAFANEVYNITVNAVFGQSEARDILDMINAFRTGEDAWYWNKDNETITECDNLGELQYDYKLEEIAMQRAAEIAVYFSHTRPDGRSLWTAYSENSFTLSAVTCGENIAAGYGSAAEVNDAWREDFADYENQRHRRNLLNKNYKSVGIGHAYYNGYHFWVQEFSGRATDSSYKNPCDTAKEYSVKLSDELISSVDIQSEIQEISIGIGETVSLPKIIVSAKIDSSWNQLISSDAAEISVRPVFTVQDSSIAEIDDNELIGVSGGRTMITAAVKDKMITIPVVVADSEHKHEAVWQNENGFLVKRCTECAEELSKLQFTDIQYCTEYGDYIEYTSVFNKFITGTNPPANNVFSPTAPITRAMFVTILYRMAGSPYDNGNNPNSSNPFSDVPQNAYYYNPACWALENGITTETMFKPFDNVSREQAATMLFRYAQANEWVDEAYKTADITNYPDYGSVHIWAQEPMQWANYNKMITGTQQGYLNPQGATQRVHATKILYGFGTSCGIGNFE